ncbi:MAG: hypothetical protein J7647_01700 [Cyanobacteria bacterium SBLK]|nr:hypothetical protein [Cyanobacteria bacterium SBLK]
MPLNLKHPCCQPQEETDLRTGAVTKSDRPHGWIARAKWRGRSSEYRIYTPESYTEYKWKNNLPQHIAGYSENLYFYGSKTTIKCVCDIATYETHRGDLFPYIQYIEAITIAGTIDTQKNIHNTTTGKTLWGLRPTKDPEEDDINTPDGIIENIVLDLLEEPDEPYGKLKAYRGPRKAFEWWEVRQRHLDRYFENSTGVPFGAYDAEGNPTTCDALGVPYWLKGDPENSKTIHGIYICKGQSETQEIQKGSPSDMGIRIARRDADAYNCGDLWKGKQAFYNLCSLKLVPEIIEKCHDLRETSRDIEWEWKQRAPKLHETTVNALVGERETEKRDRILSRPIEFEFGSIEEIEFIYCNCCDCCAIGQTVLDLFEGI